MVSGSPKTQNLQGLRRSTRDTREYSSTENVLPKAKPKPKTTRKKEISIMRVTPSSSQQQITTISTSKRKLRPKRTATANSSTSLKRGGTTNPFIPSKAKCKAIDQKSRIPISQRRKHTENSNLGGEKKFLVFNLSKQYLENQYKVEYIRDHQDKINSSNGGAQVIVTGVGQLGFSKYLGVFPGSIKVIFSNDTWSDSSSMDDEEQNQTTDKSCSDVGDDNVINGDTNDTGMIIGLDQLEPNFQEQISDIETVPELSPCSTLSTVISEPPELWA